MGKQFSRRRVLRLGAATAGVGAVGGLAGCNSVPSLGGGEKSLAYNDALFAPGDVSGTENGYVFTYSDYKALRENEDSLENGTATYEGNVDSFPFSQMGVDFDSTDANLAILTVGAGHATGSFNGSDAGSSLSDNGFSEDGSYGDYTLYSDAERTVGVKDGAAVHASVRDVEGYDRQRTIETVVDTKSGDGNRYVDGSDDFSQLDGSIYDDAVITVGGTGARVTLLAGDFENVAGYAVSARILDGGDQEIQSAHLFESEGDANVDEVEGWARDSSVSPFSDATDISASQDGRVVTVTATAQILGGSGSGDQQ